MGTRNLTVIIQNGKQVIAQYGKWDGYFSGAGLIVKNAITKNINENFIINLKKCSYISEERLKVLWNEVGSDGTGWVSCHIAEKFNELHPQLYRNMGAKIIDFLCKDNTNDIIEIDDSFEFGYDGLFCEYGYVYDLDRLCLDVYVGGQHDEVVGLWSDKDATQDNGYTAISLLKTFTINELSNMSDEEFLRILHEATDNEDM